MGTSKLDWSLFIKTSIEFSYDFIEVFCLAETFSSLELLYAKVLQNEEKNMAIQHLTKVEFIDWLHNVDINPQGWEAKHDLPVLVDFYATWCPPCKALAPLLDQLAEELEGKIQIYKVDVDQEEELTALYNVRTVPTLLFAKPSDDKPTLMLGVMGIAELREKIQNLLLS